MLRVTKSENGLELAVGHEPRRYGGPLHGESSRLEAVQLEDAGACGAPEGCHYGQRPAQRRRSCCSGHSEEIPGPVGPLAIPFLPERGGQECTCGFGAERRYFHGGGTCRRRGTGAGAKTTWTPPGCPEVDDGAPRSKIERCVRLSRFFLNRLDLAFEIEPRHFPQPSADRPVQLWQSRAG
jgi:hypothetical protein